MKKILTGLLFISAVFLMSSCTVTTSTYSPGYTDVNYQTYYWGTRNYYPTRYGYQTYYSTGPYYRYRGYRYNWYGW